MAKSREYMDYLDQAIEIAPANSQEEYQAAETIAQMMRDHGLKPTVSEFDAYPAYKLILAIVSIVLFACLVACGLTSGIAHVVTLVLGLGAAAVLLLSHYLPSFPDALGPAQRSQNVVAVHRAEGDKVVKGARPIVIVAHYDTPRESFMYAGTLGRLRASIVRAAIPCAIVVAVALAFQALAFLPAIVRTITWVVGLVACLPLVFLAVVSVIERFGACTEGANNNKASVAAMLAIMDKVRPADDQASSGERAQRPAPRQRAADREAQRAEAAKPRRVEVVEEVKGVRHGADVIAALGILPANCEVVYEEPKVHVIEEEPEPLAPVAEPDGEEFGAVEYEGAPYDAAEYDEFDEDLNEDYDEEDLGDDVEADDYDEFDEYDEFEEAEYDAFYEAEDVFEDEDAPEDEAEGADEDYDIFDEDELEDDAPGGDEYEDDEYEDDDYEDDYDDEYDYEDYDEDDYEDDENVGEPSGIGLWFKDRVAAFREYFSKEHEEDNQIDFNLDDEDGDDEYDDDYDDEYDEDEAGTEVEVEEDLDGEDYDDEEDEVFDGEDYDDEDWLDGYEYEDEPEEVADDEADEDQPSARDVVERLWREESGEADDDARPDEAQEDIDDIADEADDEQPISEELEAVGVYTDAESVLVFDDEYEQDADLVAPEYEDDTAAAADAWEDEEASGSDTDTAATAVAAYDEEYDVAEDDEYDAAEYDDEDDAAEYDEAVYEEATDTNEEDDDVADEDDDDNGDEFEHEWFDDVYDLENDDLYEGEDEEAPEEEYEEDRKPTFGERLRGMFGRLRGGHADDEYEEDQEEIAYVPDDGGEETYPASVADVAAEQEETIQYVDVIQYVDEEGNVIEEVVEYVDADQADFGDDYEEEIIYVDEDGNEIEYLPDQEDAEFVVGETVSDETADEDDAEPYEYGEDEDYADYDDAEYEMAEYEAYEDEAYEDQEKDDAVAADEPPADPNLLHFDRDEDDDIVPRDTTGLDELADSYDIYGSGEIDRVSKREAPEPIDDPNWGVSSYRPARPSLNIARRAALFDLPDPSGRSIDPLAQEDDAEYLEVDTPYNEPEQGSAGESGQDANSDARGGFWGGATVRSDLREDGDDPIVIDEADLQEAILEMGDDFLVAHDIWFVATGASEANHAGIKAFLDDHRRDIRGAFLVNLEGVGAGELSVYTKEGLHTPRRADRRLVRMLTTIANDLHIDLKTASYDWDETDAASAMRQRVRAVTVAGLDEKGVPAYSHSADDVPENVDPRRVESVVRLVCELIRRA